MKTKLSGVLLIMALSTSASSVKRHELINQIAKGIKIDEKLYHIWPRVFFEIIVDLNKNPLFNPLCIVAQDCNLEDSVQIFKNLFSTEQKQKIEEYITQSNKLIFLSDDWQKVCYVIKKAVEEGKLLIKEELKTGFINNLNKKDLNNDKEGELFNHFVREFLFHAIHPFLLERIKMLLQEETRLLTEEIKRLENKNPS